MRSINRSLMAILLVSCMLFALSSVVRASGVSVYVDGNRLADSGVMVNGSVMVPMRGIFEALGAEVKWDGPTKTVNANRGDTSIKLVLGFATASVNGKAVKLVAPASSVNGTTMVPLRFIGEALGAQVKWDGPNSTVNVYSGNEASDKTVGVSNIIVSPVRDLKTGDNLTVEADGPSNGKATFSIVGIVNDMPMHEEREGHYVGTLAITQKIVADSAALVVEVLADGKTVSKQADKTITINKSEKTRPVSRRIRVYPQRNATISQLRPTIAVTFPSNIREGAIRFYLDNDEYTHQLRYSDKSVSWQPTNDLTSGLHKVKFVGTDNNGIKIDEQWVFTIKTSDSSNVAADGEPMVTISSPRDNTAVTSAITVVGRANPGATVLIEAKEDSAQILNIISVSGLEKSASVETTAKSNGEYAATVPISEFRSGRGITVTVTATTTAGDKSNPVTVKVTKR